MPYNKAIHEWIGAVEKAGVGHSNMASSYEGHPGSLAAEMSRELQRAALGNAAFSEEFFSIQSPVDNPAQVLAILQKIYAAEPALFSEYQSLALAVAVVYDVPPPPLWPHGQVSATVLPRKLPPPEQAFAYWARLDRAGLTLQRLRRLPASELKFLVDDVTPFSELDWARQNVGLGLAVFEQAYGMIKYRKDRIDQNLYLWPGADYRLATILQQGGICVDQAYFASTAGKAKGIPTIMFRGAGLDGRHAWFGYLDAAQRWQLDCGRYAEQKYVVGIAVRPADVGRHQRPRAAVHHRAVPRAADLQALGHAHKLRPGIPQGREARARAPGGARGRQPRPAQPGGVADPAGGAEAAAPADLRAQEAVLREAVLALQRYPDLEIEFSKQLDEFSGRGARVARPALRPSSGRRNTPPTGST